MQRAAPGADAQSFSGTAQGWQLFLCPTSTAPARQGQAFRIPGIDFTDDPLLQGRNFSYLDTQLKRLGGPNFNKIPVNAPKGCPVSNYQQDGHMYRKYVAWSEQASALVDVCGLAGPEDDAVCALTHAASVQALGHGCKRLRHSAWESHAASMTPWLAMAKNAALRSFPLEKQIPPSSCPDTAIKPRKGMPRPQLGAEEFNQRTRNPFSDPAFRAVQAAFDNSVAVAWDAHDKSRKRPVTQKSGPGFSSAKHELSAGWFAAHMAVKAAQPRRG